MLTQEEMVELAFEVGRDFAILTSNRIFLVDVLIQTFLSAIVLDDMEAISRYFDKVDASAEATNPAVRKVSVPGLLRTH